MDETLSIIKYKPIEGCADQFEAKLKKLYQINKKSGFLKRLLLNLLG